MRAPSPGRMPGAVVLVCALLAVLGERTIRERTEDCLASTSGGAAQALLSLRHQVGRGAAADDVESAQSKPARATEGGPLDLTGPPQLDPKLAADAPDSQAEAVADVDAADADADAEVRTEAEAEAPPTRAPPAEWKARVQYEVRKYWRMVYDLIVTEPERLAVEFLKLFMPGLDALQFKFRLTESLKFTVACMFWFWFWRKTLYSTDRMQATSAEKRTIINADTIGNNEPKDDEKRIGFSPDLVIAFKNSLDDKRAVTFSEFQEMMIEPTFTFPTSVGIIPSAPIESVKQKTGDLLTRSINSDMLGTMRSSRNSLPARSSRNSSMGRLSFSQPVGTSSASAEVGSSKSCHGLRSVGHVRFSGDLDSYGSDFLLSPSEAFEDELRHSTSPQGGTQALQKVRRLSLQQRISSISAAAANFVNAGFHEEEAVCRNGHTLEDSVMQSECCCDECKDTFCKGTRMRICRKCGYDACLRCVRKKEAMGHAWLPKLTEVLRENHADGAEALALGELRAGMVSDLCTLAPRFGFDVALQRSANSEHLLLFIGLCNPESVMYYMNRDDLKVKLRHSRCQKCGGDRELSADCKQCQGTGRCIKLVNCSKCKGRRPELERCELCRRTGKSCASVVGDVIGRLGVEMPPTEPESSTPNFRYREEDLEDLARLFRDVGELDVVKIDLELDPNHGCQHGLTYSASGLIKRIEPGLVQDWNRKHFKDAIVPGNEIVMVGIVSDHRRTCHRFRVPREGDWDTRLEWVDIANFSHEDEKTGKRMLHLEVRKKGVNIFLPMKPEGADRNVLVETDKEDEDGSGSNGTHFFLNKGQQVEISGAVPESANGIYVKVAPRRYVQQGGSGVIFIRRDKDWKFTWDLHASMPERASGKLFACQPVPDYRASWSLSESEVEPDYRWLPESDQIFLDGMLELPTNKDLQWFSYNRQSCQGRATQFEGDYKANGLAYRKQVEPEVLMSHFLRWEQNVPGIRLTQDITPDNTKDWLLVERKLIPSPMASYVFQFYPDNLAQDDRGTLLNRTNRFRVIYQELTNFFNLDATQKRAHVIQAWYMPHEKRHLEVLRRDWSDWGKVFDPSFVQPIHFIRSYFGSRIAFVFAWMGLYCKTLLALSPLAFWSLAARYLRTDVESEETRTLAFAFVIMLWACIAENLWEREDTFFQEDWEIDASAEVDRPDFSGELRESKVDRRDSELVYPEEKAFLWMTVSNIITFAFIFTVFAFTSVVRVLFANNPELQKVGMIPVASIVMSMQIKVFESVFNFVVPHLLRLENHKEENNHYDSYVWKQFVFQFFNANIPFWFMTMKGSADGCVMGKSGSECISRVRSSLGMSFCLLAAARIGVLILQIAKVHHRRWQENLNADMDNMAGHAEAELVLADYGESQQIECMVQLTTAIGFVLMYGAACPVVIFLCLVEFMVQKGASAWFLSAYAKRPLPRKSNGVGAWHDIMKLLRVVGVANTGFLIVAYDDIFKGVELVTRLTAYLLFVGLAFCASKVVDVVIPPDDDTVSLLKARRRYIENKISRVHEEYDEYGNKVKRKGTNQDAQDEGAQRPPPTFSLRLDVLDMVNEQRWADLPGGRDKKDPKPHGL